MASHPSRRRLTIAWMLLATLTAAGLLAALSGDAPALGFGPAAVVLAASAFKAREILHIYLNLRTASAGWRGGMAAFVLVILGLVLAGQAVG